MTKVQRYKVGFFSDEWGMSSLTPCLIPDGSGYAVKFEDYCKLEAELTALKAENEWQPIETAPKETEIFIGRFIDGVFRFGRSELCYEHANEFAGETWSGWLWSIDNCNESIADCPTHWKPLPKPPALYATILQG